MNVVKSSDIHNNNHNSNERVEGRKGKERKRKGKKVKLLERMKRIRMKMKIDENEEFWLQGSRQRFGGMKSNTVLLSVRYRVGGGGGGETTIRVASNKTDKIRV